MQGAIGDLGKVLMTENGLDALCLQVSNYGALYVLALNDCGM